MVSMVDVAAQAKVSISTVSHVLNDTRPVGDATRKRVMAAIEQTGYRQDALARAMRRSRTDSIGLVVSDAGEPAFADMVHGVEMASAELGLTLLLANSAERREREARAIETLLNRRVDGLILAPAATTQEDSLRDLLQEKTPTVLLDRVFPDLEFDQVGTDNRETARRLTSQLLQQGHRRIALLAGDIRVPALQERHDGFLDALRTDAADGARHIVVTSEGPRPSDQDVRDAITSLDATAIVACGTQLAVAGLHALQDLDLHTPEDIAFATFDGFKHGELFTPQLTTALQPAFEMGEAAVRLLVDRLANPGIGPRVLRLRQNIEWRESTEANTPRE